MTPDRTMRAPTGAFQTPTRQEKKLRTLERPVRMIPQLAKMGWICPKCKNPRGACTCGPLTDRIPDGHRQARR